MIKLYDANQGGLLGEISEQQLQLLLDQLEEEWSADTDYYINQATVDMLRERGADDQLTGALSKAIAGSGEADVRWSRE